MSPNPIKSQWTFIDVFLYILLASYAIFSIGSLYKGILGLPIFPIAMLFAFFHASRRYGWSGATYFLLICLTISLAYENLSISTGFPFGFYHWSVKMNRGPWIGTVPVLTGIAYCGTGYISWVLGEILIGRTDITADKTRTVGVSKVPDAAVKEIVITDLKFNPNKQLPGRLPELEPDLADAIDKLKWANHIVVFCPVFKESINFK